ncbi:hypothetical protein EJ110_NYTH54526 [Nymphaea thermarum]|nr:hypothetical protein EJ110_NYTH54526 [Nymphaea thermarum]
MSTNEDWHQATEKRYVDEQVCRFPYLTEGVAGWAAGKWEILDGSVFQFPPNILSPVKAPGSQILATSIRDSDDQNFGCWIVDENMFLLRKRIHEMKMVERNYEAPAEVLDRHKAECGCGNNGAGGLEPTHCSFSGSLQFG